MRALSILLAGASLGCWGGSTPTPKNAEPPRSTTETPAGVSLLPEDPSLRERPQEHASFSESLASKPDWGRRNPQPEDLASLFEGASAIQGPLTRGLLICRAESPSEAWTGQRVLSKEFVDLFVRVTLPNTDPQPFYGEKDKHSALFSLPGIALQAGDAVTFELFDYGNVPGVLNFFFNENDVTKLGALRTTYESGLPLAYSGEVSVNSSSKEAASIECRGYPSAALDTKAEALMTEVDRAFLVKDANNPFSASVNMNELYGGYRYTSVARMQSAVTRLASFVGWADPRVAGRVALISQLRTTWESKLRESFPGVGVDAEARGLRKQVLRVEPKKKNKKDKKEYLQIVLEIQATSSESYTGGWSAQVQHLTGGTSELSPSLADGVPYSDFKVSLNDGQRHELIYEVDASQGVKIFCFGPSDTSCEPFWVAP